MKRDCSQSPPASCYFLLQYCQQTGFCLSFQLLYFQCRFVFCQPRPKKRKWRFFQKVCFEWPKTHKKAKSVCNICVCVDRAWYSRALKVPCGFPFSLNRDTQDSNTYFCHQFHAHLLTDSWWQTTFYREWYALSTSKVRAIYFGKKHKPKWNLCFNNPTLVLSSSESHHRWKVKMVFSVLLWPHAVYLQYLYSVLCSLL